jgi:hypothetical protein
MCKKKKKSEDVRKELQTNVISDTNGGNMLKEWKGVVCRTET